MQLENTPKQQQTTRQLETTGQHGNKHTTDSQVTGKVRLQPIIYEIETQCKTQTKSSMQLLGGKLEGKSESGESIT